MELRAIRESDLPIIAKWFEARGDGLPRRDILPMEHGLMIEEGGVPLAAGFMYVTVTSLAFLEFYQTNHEAPILKQSRAMHKLIFSMQDFAKSLGCSVILGFVPEDHTALHKLYKRAGALKNSKKMELFWKILED